ncbi:TetR family transcriptional regulator [Photobacterium kasasachensis]|uniref:TetR family transcriptional regulator n=1 Tax=Photobacterium kasasachensis TaxID=2910240 RepID=UPI003D0A7F94
MPEEHNNQRQLTHDKIRKAIIRLEKQRPKHVNVGRKISVSSVAEEAGVSRALIHNEYPDLLERIRGNANKDIQTQRDEKHQALKAEREKNRQLRATIAELNQKLHVLTSKNATLELENRRLVAIIDSENVSVLRGKKDEKA